MLSKRTKKLVSKLMRDKAIRKTWIVETDDKSLHEKWRYCRDKNDNDSWYRYTILDFDNENDAYDFAYNEYYSTRRALPYYDCSGRPFIFSFHVAPTNMPGWYVIVENWTIDV